MRAAVLAIAFVVAAGGVACSLTTSLDGVFEEGASETGGDASQAWDVPDPEIGGDGHPIFPTEDGATPDTEAPAEDTTPPPPCGADGEACCSGGACNGGLYCESGTCKPIPPPPPCGGDGQGCCAGGACNAGLYCESGTCRPIPPPPPCGGTGQACCAGSACNAGNVCSGGSCVACGGVMQPCCAGGACGGSVCIVGTCKVCCALCKNRTAYHRVDVTAACADAATSYCGVGDRGGLKDAAWGSCAY